MCLLLLASGGSTAGRRGSQLRVLLSPLEQQEGGNEAHMMPPFNGCGGHTITKVPSCFILSAMASDSPFVSPPS